MFAPDARIVVLHAHPDDETLATGVLLADLTAGRHAVAVVTATRGERGEVVPGPLAALEGTPALTEHRERELAAALGELGVTDHAFLGTGPARAAGRPPRCYADSGMRWVTPTLAGPAADATPNALTSAPETEPTADLVAYLNWYRADVLLSYDAHGGYGHPDHVACHRLGRAAAAAAGVDWVEIVSEPLLPDAAADQWRLPQWLPAVRRALGCYASQLSVDGTEVVHVGGQREPIADTVWLRRVAG